MALKWWSALVVTGVAVLWIAGGTQGEHPLIRAEEDLQSRLTKLERAVADHPADLHIRRELVQTYIDFGSPGLALRVVDLTPGGLRDAKLEHLRARALLEEGRARDALGAEATVLDLCGVNDVAPRCEAWLISSAIQRRDVLARLVEMGVEDVRAHPEASSLAVQSATRHVRLVGP